MFTRNQMRGARALLGISQLRLARDAGVSLATIRRLEQGQHKLSMHTSTAESLLEVFLKRGVKFIEPSPLGGEGVRLVSPRVSQAMKSSPDGGPKKLLRPLRKLGKAAAR